MRIGRKFRPRPSEEGLAAGRRSFARNIAATMAVNRLKDLIAKFFGNESDRCRFKLAHIRSYLWEEAFMRSFLMAALAAVGLAMAATSGAYAVPIAPIGKGAEAIDSRVEVTYYRYYHRHHHRRCWWHHGHRHCRW